LNIVSLQDSDTYKASSKNAGIGFGTDKISGVHGSAGTSKTNSNYKSVTDQAGIYAGKDGFDIHVGKNTDLKGAVISSTATPDKNKISTDTLTWMDLHNKAKYSASSVGVNYDSKKYSPLDENYKNQGLIPNIGVTASGKADSITKTAISPGTIEIRSNPNQDLSKISRDTINSVNALGKIFDKAKIEEQRELASMFGEVAFKAIGDLELPENSPLKAALKATIGGIMSKIAGGSFTSGATSAGFTQYITNELTQLRDPALIQWASFVVGATVSELTGGNGLTGGSITVNDIRNNWLASGHNTLIKVLQADHVMQNLRDLGWNLTDADIIAIQEGSKQADKEQPGNLALHASPECSSMFDILDEFEKNMHYAINLENQGEHEEAMRFLGFAIHTSEDLYSHWYRGSDGSLVAHVVMKYVNGELTPLPDNPNNKPELFASAKDATIIAAQIFANGKQSGTIDRNLLRKIFPI